MAMAEFQIGIPAAQPALGQQGGSVGRGPGEAALPRLDEHMGKARLKRDGGDFPAMTR